MNNDWGLTRECLLKNVGKITQTNIYCLSKGSDVILSRVAK